MTSALELDHVTVHLAARGGRRRGVVHAVEDVSIDVAAGETVSLVGESGSGKSTLARAATRLLEPTSGRVLLEGRDITGLHGRALRDLRPRLQLVFQDPATSLNPRHPVGTILGAPFQLHKRTPAGGVDRAVGDLLERVGLDPRDRHRYPHEFSGGQRQRIGIARAIALRPSVLVLDEPVSALDVSVRAQVLALLAQLQQEEGTAYLMVAHDLALVRHVSDRVAVMYLGRIVELAAREELYAHPRHPYTHALLSAVPDPDPRAALTRERIVLRGDMPSPLNPPTGCVFRTRCWKAESICATQRPPLQEHAPGHLLACHFPEIAVPPGEVVVGPVPPDADDPVAAASFLDLPPERHRLD